MPMMNLVGYAPDSPDEVMALALRSTFGQHVVSMSPQMQRLMHAHATPRGPQPLSALLPPTRRGPSPRSSEARTAPSPTAGGDTLSLPVARVKRPTPSPLQPNSRRTSFSPGLTSAAAGLHKASSHRTQAAATTTTSVSEIGSESQDRPLQTLAASHTGAVLDGSGGTLTPFLSPHDDPIDAAVADEYSWRSGSGCESGINSSPASAAVSQHPLLVHSALAELDAAPAKLGLPATLLTSATSLSPIASVRSPSEDSLTSSFRTMSSDAIHPADADAVAEAAEEAAAATALAAAEAALPIPAVPRQSNLAPALLSSPRTPAIRFQPGQRRAAPGGGGLGYTPRAGFAEESEATAGGTSSSVVRIIAPSNDAPPQHRHAAHTASMQSLSDGGSRTQPFRNSATHTSRERTPDTAAKTEEGDGLMEGGGGEAEGPPPHDRLSPMTESDGPNSGGTGRFVPFWQQAERGAPDVAAAADSERQARPTGIPHSRGRRVSRTGSDGTPSRNKGTACSVHPLHSELSNDALVPAFSSCRDSSSSAGQASFLASQHSQVHPATGSSPRSPSSSSSTGTSSTTTPSLEEDDPMAHSLRSLPALHVSRTTSIRKVKDAKGRKFLNGYLIVKDIGCGSTGKVRLAFDATRSRLVAIKEVVRANRKHRIGGKTDAQYRYESALREIELMMTLRHKNVVSIYEVIDDPSASSVYIVMQYVDNGVIANISVKEGTDQVCEPIPPQRLAVAARQMLAGLDYLHRKNVVHRDIKPDNILVDKEGRVYLADFGVAENFDTQHRERLERAMQASMAESLALSAASGTLGCGPKVLGTKGTPLFIAPELYAGQRSYGKPVDIWALGVTLFTLLTGRLPFRNPMEVSDPLLPVFPEEFGPAWAMLLRGMMARKPANRLTAAEARAMVKKMHRSSSGSAVLTPEAAKAPVSPDEVAPQSRRRPPPLPLGKSPTPHPPSEAAASGQRGRRRPFPARATPPARRAQEERRSSPTVPEDQPMPPSLKISPTGKSHSSSFVAPVGNSGSYSSSGWEDSDRPLPQVDRPLVDNEDDERQEPLFGLQLFGESGLPHRTGEFGSSSFLLSAADTARLHQLSTTLVYKAPKKLMEPDGEAKVLAPADKTVVQVPASCPARPLPPPQQTQEILPDA